VRNQVEDEDWDFIFIYLSIPAEKWSSLLFYGTDN
jgi:hypothetical protein